MESKKKLLEWFKNNLKDESKFTLEEFANACLEISNEAKKEVFDDLEKLNQVIRFVDTYSKFYIDFKKRHLSTFAKSNIIADKQNPQKDLCEVCPEKSYYPNCDENFSCPIHSYIKDFAD